MVFSDSIFLFIFLPIVLAGYYFFHLFKNILVENLFLLFVSLAFYTYGNYQFLKLLLFSICINYLSGILVHSIKKDNFRKITLFFSVFANLAILFHYKYQDFVASNLNNIFKTEFMIRNIVLPIGISFFTFQALSYVVDVYRGTIKVQKNPIYLALYVSFFPQLIAGPIVRYETIEEQITNREIKFNDFSDGVIRFATGLCKKVLLANNLAIVADFVFNNLNNNGYCSSVSTVWIGAIAYTLQILFDFSGYSDMAIGLGKMFGFKFNENFDYPYMATSVTDFWRRWHISLSSWFRDYVYIPLGGNKCSKIKHVFNLAVVWLLTGIWHGANWTFIFWGILYFIILVLEKYIIKPDEIKKSFCRGLYRIFTLFIIIIAWVLFRSTNISEAMIYIGMMFGIGVTGVTDINTGMLINEFWVFIVAGILCSFTFKSEKYSNVVYVIKNIALVFLVLISIVYIINGSYNPFIYFNF